MTDLRDSLATMTPPPSQPFPTTRSLPKAAVPPITITEALDDLKRQQATIRVALERLIDNATSILAQL